MKHQLPIAAGDTMAELHLEGVAALAIDCHEPQRLGRFWSTLLGGRITDVDANGDTSAILPGGLTLDFFKVPESKTVKNRLHLDRQHQLRDRDRAGSRSGCHSSGRHLLQG